MNEFDNKFNKLIGICEQSSQSAIRLWSNSLKKLHQKLFMIYLKIPFFYQKKTILLQFFRIFFRRKLYMFGSNSLLNFSEFIFGSERLILNNTGHFAFYDDKTKFFKYFFKTNL